MTTIVLEEPGHNDRDFLAQWKQIKDAQSLNNKALYNVFSTTATPDSGPHTATKTAEMSRHPPLYSVHLPQSAYNSDGIPQISVQDNYERPPSNVPII